MAFENCTMTNTEPPVPDHLIGHFWKNGFYGALPFEAYSQAMRVGIQRLSKEMNVMRTVIS